ncbi:TRAP transporter large permease subunit [Chloroflexota bacterium]
MWLQASAGVLNRFVQSLGWWGAVAGAISLIGIVLLTTADVFSRFVFGLPMIFTIEVVQLMLVIVMLAGMAYTELRKGHVRVNILVDKFSPTAKLVTDTSTTLVALTVTVILAWQSVVYAQGLASQNQEVPILRIPLWPVVVIAGFCFLLFALAVSANFIESLGKLKANGAKSFLWLIPGIIIVAALIGTSLQPALLAIDIPRESFGLLSLVILFGLIFLGLHIGAAMAMITLWGTSYLMSAGAGLSMLGFTAHTVASSYIWSVFPLFVFAGVLFSTSGFSRDLYNTGYKFLGQLPGGLASATVAACAGFSAVVGDSLSGTVTMGKIAAPQMKSYKYDTGLTMGSIAAGGSMGTLIPPGLGFVVYGIMVEESIGRLFIAGILPGVLMTASFIALIWVRCRLNPTLGPAGPRTSIMEKLISLKGSWTVAFIFVLVIGGIYLGIFSPNEAGALAAFSALVIGFSLRRLGIRSFVNTVIEAVQITAMIFFIFIFAVAATQYFALSDLTFALADWVAALPVPPLATMGVILFVYLILGCLMNSLPVLILTLPILYPVVMGLGFDSIWFGVLVVIMAEIGVLTPPIGMGVFALSGVTSTPIYTVFRGVIPFWIVMLCVVTLILFFPQIALFLPNLMMGR